MSSSASASSTTTSSPADRKLHTKTAAEAWKRAEKVPSELLQLTYGCFVAQLWEDANMQTVGSEFSNSIPAATKVNGELFEMGKKIGLRMADDFIAQMSLAGWEVGQCKTSSSLADIISCIAFPLYLNILPPTIIDLDDDGFTLRFQPNAKSSSFKINSASNSRAYSTSSTSSTSSLGKLSINDCNTGCGLSLQEDPVFLPKEAKEGDLHYSQIICGILVGSLDAVGKRVDCEIISDPYLSDAAAEGQHLEIRLSMRGRRSPLPLPSDN